MTLRELLHPEFLKDLDSTDRKMFEMAFEAIEEDPAKYFKYSMGRAIQDTKKDPKFCYGVFVLGMLAGFAAADDRVQLKDHMRLQ